MPRTWPYYGYPYGWAYPYPAIVGEIVSDDALEEAGEGEVDIAKAYRKRLAKAKKRTELAGFGGLGEDLPPQAYSLEGLARGTQALSDSTNTYLAARNALGRGLSLAEERTAVDALFALLATLRTNLDAWSRLRNASNVPRQMWPAHRTFSSAYDRARTTYSQHEPALVALHNNLAGRELAAQNQRVATANEAYRRGAAELSATAGPLWKKALRDFQAVYEAGQLSGTTDSLWSEFRSWFERRKAEAEGEQRTDAGKLEVERRRGKTRGATTPPKQFSIVPGAADVVEIFKTPEEESPAAPPPLPDSPVEGGIIERLKSSARAHPVLWTGGVVALGYTGWRMWRRGRAA